MRWTFQPDEFMHVWAETDIDVHPEPLQIWSRYRTELEAAAAWREIRARLPHRRDPDLSVALHVLAAPDTRVTMIGNRDDGRAAVRIGGCALAGTAVVVHQDPGPDPDHGDDIHVWLGSRTEMAARTAGVMPRAPGGRLPKLHALTAQLVAEPVVRTTMSALPGSPSPIARIRRLLAAQHVARGAVRIETRLHDDQPPPATYLSWIDVLDDGRYIVRNTDHDTGITPADKDFIIRWLRRATNTTP